MGYFFWYSSNLESHFFSKSSPLLTAFLKWSYTSLGISNGGYSQFKNSLVNEASSSPTAAPWIPAVSDLLGEP